MKSAKNETSDLGTSRKPATRATPAQLLVLKNVFCHSPSPSSQIYKNIAEETGLPLKWISQWFGRQRTKGRKQKDSAPNSRSRTGSTVVDSLDSRSTPESFSKSNMSALSTGEIIQVKKEQQDGQSSFSTSGFVIDTVVPYTPGGLSAADPSNRQPSCAKACDNTRDAYSRSKIGFTPENVVAGGAYTSLLATDSPISRRGNLSTAIGPPKKSVLSVQSTTESTLPSSSVGPEARLVPPSDAHLKSISCHSFEHSVAVSAAREAAHAIKLAYSNDEAALDSQLLYTSETLGHVENKGTRISSRRKCSAAPLSCLQPLAPVQSHSIKVSSNLPPHDNVAKQGAYSKASHPSNAIDPDILNFPGISKSVDFEALDPSRAPLKHLTHLLEGYKAENETYDGLLIAAAVPSFRKPLIDCLTDTALVPFEAAMGISLL